MRFGSATTPVVADSTDRRDKLNADIEAFLAQGGEITQIETGVSGENIGPARDHAKLQAQRDKGVYSDKKAGSGKTPWRKGVKR